MFRIKLFIIGLIGAAMFLTSCEEDSIGGPGGNNGPIVDISDDFQGSLTFDQTLEPGQTFTIQIDAFATDAAVMTSIAVSRNGIRLLAQADPINGTLQEFDNLNIADAEQQNPQALFGADADAFTWTFEFVAPTEMGDFTYEFVVTDASVPQLSTEQVLTITVAEPLVVDNPMVTYIGPPNIDSPAGSLVRVNIAAVTGTNNFASVSVWEDEVLVDAMRLRFADTTITENPLPLVSPQSEGFAEGVTIETIAGTHNYIIRVTDTSDNNGDIMFTITESMTSTPLENIFPGVLFSNASGPSNGGLDLDFGVAVASASMAAEIRDLGIDTNQPATSNWIQSVEAVNGSELRIINLANLPDGFTFAAVTSKEQVADAFNSGTTVNESPVLQVGDLLAVSSPTNIYIMEVEEVNVTETDNNDNYLFSIKF